MEREIKIGDIFRSVIAPKCIYKVYKIKGNKIYIEVLSHSSERFIGIKTDMTVDSIKNNWEMIIKTCYPDE